jgi:hypothetical protein
VPDNTGALRAARIITARAYLIMINYSSLLYLIRHAAFYPFRYLSLQANPMNSDPGVVPLGTRLS